MQLLENLKLHVWLSLYLYFYWTVPHYGLGITAETQPPGSLQRGKEAIGIF